jgi:hypothetical protein
MQRVSLIGIVFGIQLVTGAASFLNYVAGWHTEKAYFVYYCFTFVVYLVAVGFFLYNYHRLPQYRARMKWIVAAAIVGLPCFIFADLVEATSFGDYLPHAVDAWIDSHNWILNVLYAMNVVMPAAVVYTALNHEVMSVRFGVTRAVILSTVFVVCVATLDLLVKAPLEHWMQQQDTLRDLAVPISFAIAAALALVHNPLHGVVERVLAPRWHRGKQQMQALALRLLNDDVTLRDVDRVLVHDAAQALWLRCAALFRRHHPELFVIDEQFNWPAGARRELHGDDPWVKSVSVEPVPLADADAAPMQPELAVPIQCTPRHPIDRVVLYGHHDSSERIDPDEIRLLREVSRAAALAYMRLDLEAVANAASTAAASAREVAAGGAD